MYPPGMAYARLFLKSHQKVNLRYPSVNINNDNNEKAAEIFNVSKTAFNSELPYSSHFKYYWIASCHTPNWHYLRHGETNYIYIIYTFCVFYFEKSIHFTLQTKMRIFFFKKGGIHYNFECVIMEFVSLWQRERPAAFLYTHAYYYAFGFSFLFLILYRVSRTCSTRWNTS